MVGNQHTAVEENEGALGEPESGEHQYLEDVEVFQSAGDQRVVFACEVIGNWVTDIMFRDGDYKVYSLG
jgi:hypothetical protein